MVYVQHLENFDIDLKFRLKILNLESNKMKAVNELKIKVNNLTVKSEIITYLQSAMQCSRQLLNEADTSTQHICFRGERGLRSLQLLQF